MKTLNRALGAVFKPARKRDTTEANASRRARAMAETLDVTFDMTDSRRGATAIWITGGAAARLDGERFCTSWSEAAEKLEYLIVSPDDAPAESPDAPRLGNRARRSADSPSNPIQE